jgi:hypothetical protein
MRDQILKGEYDFNPEYWCTVSKQGKEWINPHNILPSKRICLAISLVRELMTVDASERIDLKHSMEHAWMKLEVKMTG